MPVPEVLVNGNHDEIRKWRRRCALEKTLRNRPDLLRGAELSKEDRKLLAEIEAELAAGKSMSDSLTTDVILKRFEEPDETRVFEKGRFELVQIGGMTIGRATYEPGWKWSEDVDKPLGVSSCLMEHVGMVVSIRAETLAKHASFRIRVLLTPLRFAKDDRIANC